MSETIASVSERLKLIEQAQTDEPSSGPSRPARRVLTDFAWPEALRVELKNNPQAVPLIVPGVPVGCPNCGGADNMYIYVYTSGPRPHPSGRKEKWLEGYGLVPGWYSGQMMAAPCPVCQGDERRSWLAANCGLSGGDRQVSLEEFKAGGIFVGKEAALRAARVFLAQNAAPRGFLTFWGDVGRGKSHLLKALVNGFVGVGVHARYINGGDLLAEIRDRFSEPNGGIAVEEAIRFYRRVRVLCVDEMDKIYLTPWAESVLHRLIDTRYNEQAACLTVLAMNPDPAALPEELEYLRSRMQGGVVVEVAGPDMRIYQGKRAQKVLDLDKRRDLD